MRNLRRIHVFAVVLALGATEVAVRRQTKLDTWGPFLKEKTEGRGSQRPPRNSRFPVYRVVEWLVGEERARAARLDRRPVRPYDL